MTRLDITNSPFLDVNCDEANIWLNDNIGTLIHDEPDFAYGEGWRIRFDPTRESEGRWLAEFEKESHAMFFLLRWS